MASSAAGNAGKNPQALRECVRGRAGAGRESSRTLKNLFDFPMHNGRLVKKSVPADPGSCAPSLPRARRGGRSDKPETPV